MNNTHHPHTRASHIAAACTITIFLTASLSACSSAKSMTCEQFGALSSHEQSSTIQDLIEAHDLDPLSSVLGTVAVEQDVDSYCGISSVDSMMGQGKASQNTGSPIDNAVNWSKYSD